MAWRAAGRAAGRMLRDQGHMGDAAVLLFFKGTDLGLPHHPGPVLKDGLQLHIGAGHGKDAPGDGQHLAHLSHRLLKGAGHPVEGGQDQVPEGLSSQGALLKAVGEQPLHDRLHVGQGLHAVADIPGGRHADVPAQHAGAAPVVGHSDHRRQVFGVFFQSPQHGGQPCPPADGGDLRAALPLVQIWNGVRHSGTSLQVCSVRSLRPAQVPVALRHRVAPAPDIGRQRMGNGHRAVVSAGAAHRHH